MQQLKIMQPETVVRNSNHTTHVSYVLMGLLKKCFLENWMIIFKLAVAFLSTQ